MDDYRRSQPSSRWVADRHRTRTEETFDTSPTPTGKHPEYLARWLDHLPNALMTNAVANSLQDT